MHQESLSQVVSCAWIITFPSLLILESKSMLQLLPFHATTMPHFFHCQEANFTIFIKIFPDYSKRLCSFDTRTLEYVFEKFSGLLLYSSQKKCIDQIDQVPFHQA